MPSSSGQLIVLAGNIATGKSTLAAALAHKLGHPLVEESVEDNPYLSRFYEDMTRWAFHLNMYFLGSRSQAVLQATASGSGAVVDRSLYEDRIFVDMAHEDGIAPDDHYLVFRSIYDTLEELLPAPAALIYLHAPVTSLRARIAARGRPFEEALSGEYLERLQTRYEGWITNFELCPVIQRDTGLIDYRSDQEAAANLCDEVQALIKS